MVDLYDGRLRMQRIDSLPRGAGKDPSINAQRGCSAANGTVAIIDIIVQSRVDTLLRVNEELIFGKIRRSAVDIDAR